MCVTSGSCAWKLAGAAEGGGFIHPREKEAERCLFAVCHCLEGGCRQDGARLFSERHRRSAGGNSHDLQQGKFMPAQGVELDTARGPFPSKSFCDSLLFTLIETKPKY